MTTTLASGRITTTATCLPLEEPPYQRKVRSYVRREGRVTRGQQRALDEVLPRYELGPDRPADLDRLFGRTAPRTLEIGFGNGASLAQLACAQPDHDFIGIEVHRPGVGHLLQLIEANELANIRVATTDAVEVLDRAIPDSSLDRVLILFPDPWHKKKHHKRRLVQGAFIELLSRRMKHGSILHMATDWAGYAEHMLGVMGQTDLFRNRAGKGRYSEKPAYRNLTKFEQRGLRLGHRVFDLVFERV